MAATARGTTRWPTPRQVGRPHLHSRPQAAGLTLPPPPPRLLSLQMRSPLLLGVHACSCPPMRLRWPLPLPTGATATIVNDGCMNPWDVVKQRMQVRGMAVQGAAGVAHRVQHGSRARMCTGGGC